MDAHEAQSAVAWTTKSHQQQFVPAKPVHWTLAHRSWPWIAFVQICNQITVLAQMSEQRKREFTIWKCSDFPCVLIAWSWLTHVPSYILEFACYQILLAIARTVKSGHMWRVLNHENAHSLPAFSAGLPIDYIFRIPILARKICCELFVEGAMAYFHVSLIVWAATPQRLSVGNGLQHRSRRLVKNMLDFTVWFDHPGSRTSIRSR